MHASHLSGRLYADYPAQHSFQALSSHARFRIRPWNTVQAVPVLVSNFRLFIHNFSILPLNVGQVIGGGAATSLPHWIPVLCLLGCTSHPQCMQY
jgi:hypothetical protein